MKTRTLSLIIGFTCSAAFIAPAARLSRPMTVKNGDRTITVTPLSDYIVKVTNVGRGESVPESRASVIDGRRYTGTTDMDVNISQSGVLTISANGRQLLTDAGSRQVADGKNSVELTLAGHGSLYGAGERGHKLNLRGDTLVMYNRQNYGYTGTDPRINQMNITMPLFLSTDGYAVVFDDFGAGEMILGDPVKYITESNHPVSYYFITSKDGSLASLTESLTELTGRQELPPLWSMGYITSKYGYRTQDETTSVIDTLKQAGYPVDGIVLDLYWYGKEQDMGRLAWDPVQWPEPEKMLADLKKQGVNLVAISQPYILRNGEGVKNYNELAPKGMFVRDSTGAPQEVKIWVGEGAMWDVSNPDTRKWLSNRYGQLTDMGVTGWWGDLGEPEVHPETGLHANGLTARQYHNQYGNVWSSIIYDLFKEKYPDTRLMTLMRGGTTGLQRFNVFPWSTDVSRSWGGMAPQVVIMTQSGLSGLGYMGHDVGGFAVDPKNPVDPELYVRWLQLGTFSPILRTHAQVEAEPYKYTDYQDIILPLVKERYRWLPYNYTLAWENASKGYPLVRPLEFHSTAPTGKYDNVTNQYMWGSEVMVVPVMKKGADKTEVIFPATSPLWFDFHTPSKMYSGGSTAVVDAPLDVLPMFVKAGAFIPTADYVMNNTGDYRRDQYTITYFPVPGIESSYTLFEDDVTSPSSKSANKGLEMTMTGNASDESVRVVFKSTGTYPGVEPVKNITLVVNNIGDKPKSVTVNGRKIKDYTFEEKSSTVTVVFRWNTTVPTAVKLNF